MIEFRHHPNRTVELSLDAFHPETEWQNIPYSPYYYRTVTLPEAHMLGMLIKHEDDIDWGR